MFSEFFPPQNYAVYEIMWKNMFTTRGHISLTCTCTVLYC